MCPAQEMRNVGTFVTVDTFFVSPLFPHFNHQMKMARVETADKRVDRVTNVTMCKPCEHELQEWHELRDSHLSPCKGENKETKLHNLMVGKLPFFS